MFVSGFGVKVSRDINHIVCTFTIITGINRPADYFIACYTVLTRAKKLETAVHGFQFGLYHVATPLSFFT